MKILDKKELQRLYFDKKMTLDEIGKLYNISHTIIAKRMDRYGFNRRDRSEAAYVYHNKNECFSINGGSNKLLKIIGPILYWCEGTNYIRKDKTDGTLAFTNTNAEMLKIWLKFLFEVCNLNRSKVRIRLYIHKNQNSQHLKKYWSKILKVPVSNFENVSYTKKDSVKSGYKGTVKIRVHNIKLRNIMCNMIAETITVALES